MFISPGPPVMGEGTSGSEDPLDNSAGLAGAEKREAGGRWLKSYDGEGDGMTE